MVDVLLLAKPPLVAALVAAVVMRLSAWGTPRLGRRNACWTWAIGAGVLVASGATDQWPHWPPLEDRARFLTLLVPLTMAAETVLVIAQSRIVTWVVRLALAAIVAPVLLFNTVYLADLNGPGSAEWSAALATMILGGIAAPLALVWTLLSGLQSRTSTQAVMWVLALDALAAAVTIMLSGYFRAGLLGLGVAGAIAGATVTAQIVRPQSPARGSLGMSVIGIFAVVLMGRFFAALSTDLAAVLLLAPLLAWSFELSWLRERGPGWRAVGRLACVAIPLIVVVIVAQRKFSAASAARYTSPKPSATGGLIDK